jgi:uncharacterized cupredoxin-like copper-binding protein
VQPRISRAPLLVVIVGGLLAISLVVLGAKLAGQPAPTPDLSSPGTAGHPRAVSVIMRDYLFNPSTLYLVSGETVEFHLFNAGIVSHEFVLGDAVVQAAWRAADAATPPAAFATPPPASVPPGIGGLRVLLPSGASGTVTYTVPASVPLELLCQLPGHAERGMVAEVVTVSR